MVAMVMLSGDGDSVVDDKWYLCYANDGYGCDGDVSTKWCLWDSGDGDDSNVDVDRY